jgi:aldose 1-epimerase
VLAAAPLLSIVLSIPMTGVQPGAVRQPGGSSLYSARHVGTVVELHDSATQTAVSIIPTLGNLTVEMKVKGHNVLRFPFESAADYKGGASSIGIPFLAPWADRLDEQAFYANGTRYAFDMTLGNVRGANPIHGFLSSASEWTVVEARADSHSAWVTSRLEFSRQPLWMKQFPFAHTIEMTHRLGDGVLEVATRIDNLSAEPMPVAIGFHPFFQLTDSSRDEWVLSVGARTHWPVAETKMPTGVTEPIDAFFSNPAAIALAPIELDDVFSDLVRDAGGRATMSLRGKAQRLEVVLGANYRAVVIYAPKAAPGQDAAARNFICIEPVAGIINALNLAHKGVYKELQSIPPAGVWQESFWIRPRGF